MKRILTAVMLGTVSMFFTGCSEGLIKGADIGTGQRMEDAAFIAESETGGDMNIKVDYDGESMEEMEDYYEYSEQQKKENQKGDPAFVIPEGQMEAGSEIENFRVLDMVNENTFLYTYSIVTPLTEKREKVLHCACIRNFRTGELRLIHRTESEREEHTASEAFFSQWCRGDAAGDLGKLFVYDNGTGSFYDLNTLEEAPLFQTEVESFMRRFLTKPAGVNIVNAVSDGKYGIYMETALEKEGTLSANEEASEEELENDVIQTVFAYEFVPLPAGIHLRQDNGNFERQVEKWKEKTEGKVLEDVPDAAGDWEQVLKELPNVWEATYIPELESAEVNRWKQSPVYGYEQDGYVCTFQAADGSLQPLTDPPENGNLENILVTWKGYDYMLYAYGEKFTDCGARTIARTVTVKTGTDENGNDITKTQEQSMTVYEKRQQILSSVTAGANGKRQGAWMEGYRILKNGEVSVSAVYGEESSEILCEAGGKLYWMDPSKNYQEIPVSLSEEEFLSIFRDGDQTRLVKEGRDNLIIYEDLCRDGAGGSLVISLADLASRYRQGDGEAEKDFGASFGEDLEGTMFEGTDIYSDSLKYSGENIRSITVAGSADMDRLREEWGEDVLGLKAGTVANGYLFTSQTQGMSIYLPATKKTFSIHTGGWYRTWEKGEDYIAIGFDGEYALNGEDLAYAGILEFDVQELLNEAVRDRLAAHEQEAAEAAEEEARKASRAAENGHRLEMEEEWNEINKNRNKG